MRQEDLGKTDWAFPWVAAPIDCMSPGMTLRDWFAGQCLASIARSAVDPANVRKGTAEWAYAVADAMLAEREKKA